MGNILAQLFGPPEESAEELEKRELEEIRKNVENDYQNLQKEKELFSKKFTSHSNIFTWSDEEDWSENHI